MWVGVPLFFRARSFPSRVANSFSFFSYSFFLELVATSASLEFPSASFAMLADESKMEREIATEKQAQNRVKHREAESAIAIAQ